MHILFEDSHFLVINKPAGIHSAGMPESDGPSIAHELVRKFPGQDKVSEKPEDGGLIHRLDFETSGLLIAARTREAWLKLRNLLKSGEVKKSYFALVEGRLSKKLEIETFLGGKGRRSQKVKVYLRAPASGPRLLAAISHISPLQYFEEINATAVSVTAPTARRHQVRAHCAHAGHPLVGDVLYGATTRLSDVFEKSKSLSKQTLPAFILHADSLEFLHPENKIQIQLKAELPDYAADLIRGAEKKVG